MNRPGRRGLTLLEILITVSLVVIFIGTAFVEYGEMVEYRKEGRARADMVQFVKALKAFSERSGWPDSAKPPIETPWRDPPRFYVHEFEALFRQKIMLKDAKNPLADPWDNDYWIDITRGIIGCAGRDRKEGTGDDIEVPFRPAFGAQKARHDVRGNTIVIDFTRPVERATVTTSTILVEGAGASAPTTALLDQANPFRVRLPLRGTLAVGTVLTVRLVDVVDGPRVRSVRALDQTTIGVPSGLPRALAVPVSGL